MPVQLPTLSGKADPTVIRALTDIANAVNALEQRVMQQAQGQGDPGLATAVRTVTLRADDLARRVLALENP